MKNDNFTIRIAETGDAEVLLGIYAPYVLETAITFEYEVPSLEEFTGRMNRIQSNYPWLVAEMDGEIVGYAYAGTFKDRPAYDWSVETSIYVKKGQKRNGIGSRLYEALEACLSRQGILNVNACIAYPKQEDETLTLDSVRFHEKYGYKEVGIFHDCGYKGGRWYDMIWMEKMLGEHRDDQPKVQPFSEKFFTCRKG